MAKLGVIVCVHNSERSDIEPRSIWPLEKRWFTNAPTRMTAFASAMEARGDLDFCADLGDLVSAESQQALTELTEITDCLENNCCYFIQNSLNMHLFAVFGGGRTL